MFRFRLWDSAQGEFVPYPCWFNHLEPNNFTCFDRYFTLSDEGCVLQQATGLLDKNGNDIYEGDLVNFSCNYTVELGEADIVEWRDQEVYYDDKMAGFFFGREHHFQILDKIIPGSIEVAGHIFLQQDGDGCGVKPLDKAD
jgi:uncharacterized phage protein (TIGR01671 family)